MFVTSFQPSDTTDICVKVVVVTPTRHTLYDLTVLSIANEQDVNLREPCLNASNERLRNKLAHNSSQYAGFASPLMPQNQHGSI